MPRTRNEMERKRKWCNDSESSRRVSAQAHICVNTARFSEWQDGGGAAFPALGGRRPHRGQRPGIVEWK